MVIKMKKLLSIVLITAMILSLIPSVFANTEASDLVLAYNFDFGAAGYEGIVDDPSKDWIVSNADAETPVYANTNTDPWFVDGWQNIWSNNVFLTSNAQSGNQMPNSLYWNIAKNTAQGGNVTIIRVKIDEPGEYYPEISFYAYNNLLKYDVYLVPFVRVNETYQSKVTAGSGSIVGNLMAQIGIGNIKNILVGTVNMQNDTTAKTLTTDDFGGNKITLSAEDAGEYYLILITSADNTDRSSTMYVNLDSFKLYEEQVQAEFTPDADESYEQAPETATVNRLAYYGEGVDAETIGETTSVTYGDSLTIVGAEKTVTKDGKTYNFLYWARGLYNGAGNKTILSTDLSFTYKPSEGNNYLIAVYEEDGKAEEAFYNYNGQLLTDLEIKDNKLPALPAMAGLGAATKWVQRGTNAEFAGSAAAPTTGDMVFMAKYAEPEADITINGKSFEYGEKVICKELVDNTENFSYWTRTIGNGEPEIISIDANYSFSAFTNCTVAAVCNGNVTIEAPKKIVLSTFSVGDKLTAVMAEFIGFENAKEKGIMFGSKKIAMTTDKAQFTVTNDTNDDVVVKGYAIVGDDRYVDGEITVDAAK